MSPELPENRNGIAILSDYDKSTPVIDNYVLVCKHIIEQEAVV